MADQPHWLRGRVAVVTGASRGIGRATAEAMAAVGAHVVLVARTSAVLAEVARAIEKSGGAATPLAADVSHPDDVQRIFAEAAGIGNPTVLVCAAGVLTRVSFEEMTPQVWTETLAVNLSGMFLCCQAAFNLMRRAGGGRIVNLGSLSGMSGPEKFPGLSAYNVSKYGVIGLTEAIAVEGREHNISAVAISPGAVDTEMLRQANPNLKPGLTPAEVAQLIVALLNAHFDALSGANIPLYSNR